MVDVRGERFVELYATESREHIELLTRSLLRMERGEPGVEEAFRAAHTLKGLAAAMSHDAVAEMAHRLEDRLSAVRDGSVEITPGLVDELLDGADGLEGAIRGALAGEGGVQATTGAPSLTGAHGGSARGGVAPDGAVWELVATLAADAALPAARAALIRKAINGLPGVCGMWPAAGEPVDREVRVFIDDRADRSAVEEVVRGCGDIEDVHVRAAGAAVSSERLQPGEPASSTAASRTVRVDRGRLDELAEGIAELSVLYARAEQSGENLAGSRAASLLAALQQTVLDMRMVQVSTAFERLPRLVRDTARIAGKEVDFELRGGDIELDQVVLDALIDPLIHILRNAVDHGIELPDRREKLGKPRRGLLEMEAMREHSSVRIRVSDDGGGVARDRVVRRAAELNLLSPGDEPTEDEVFRLMFQPGFSTADQVSELSGRGVGLDVVGARVRGLGGAIEMTTKEGAGTTFTLRVPITLALTHALRIRLGEEEYGLPITHVSEVAPLGDDAAGSGVVRVRGESIPLVDLGRVLGSGGGPPTAAVIAGLGERRVALGVDRVVSHEQILVKAFDAPAGMLPVFSGATLLPDGRPALLIDPLSIL